MRKGVIYVIVIRNNQDKIISELEHIHNEIIHIRNFSDHSCCKKV
jgi:hypothetical protein